MFRVFSNMTIKQRPNNTFKNRNKSIKLDFVNYFEWNSKWSDMTDNGKVIIPKNLQYKDENNAFNPLNGSKVNIGGYTEGVEPLIMRGDKVTLDSGYMYFNKEGREVLEMTGQIIPPSTVKSQSLIEGYISKVYSNTPIEFDVEDNMWILKQTPITNKTFTANDTLEDILKLIVDKANEIFKTSLTYNALTKTNFGEFLCGNETASQLLNRLHSTYGFNSYFRGNELRCGLIIYNPNDTQTQVFIMNGAEGNVCADGQELEYQRREDVILSARAYNTITEQTGGTTKDSQSKTRKNRIEVLCTIQNGVETTKVIEKGEYVPEAMEGERRTFFFPEATTTTRLSELAFEKLKQYYYTGLKGSFETFGIPFVRHGDNVDLRNPINPEQNGIYKVKGVSYFGGVDGLRQRIELDFKLP